jgi:hypothetical protein
MRGSQPTWRGRRCRAPPPARPRPLRRLRCPRRPRHEAPAACPEPPASCEQVGGAARGRPPGSARSRSRGRGYPAGSRTAAATAAGPFPLLPHPPPASLPPPPLPPAPRATPRRHSQPDALQIPSRQLPRPASPLAVGSRFCLRASAPPRHSPGSPRNTPARQPTRSLVIHHTLLRRPTPWSLHPLARCFPAPAGARGAATPIPAARRRGADQGRGGCLADGAGLARRRGRTHADGLRLAQVEHGAARGLVPRRTQAVAHAARLPGAIATLL